MSDYTKSEQCVQTGREGKGGREGEGGIKGETEEGTEGRREGGSVGSSYIFLYTFFTFESRIF